MVHPMGLGIRVAAAAVATAFAVHLLHGLTGFGGHTVDVVVEQWVYDLLTVSAALACAHRAWRVPVERGAWAAIAAALACSASADIVWSVLYAGDAEPPYPSVVDALYLAYYPLVFVGVVRLAVPDRRARAALWLDGLAAALAVASVTIAFVLGPVADASTGPLLRVATTLAYPLCDVLLLALIAATVTTAGGGRDRRWLLLAGGLAVWAVTDSVYLVESARGSYVEGGILDSGWPAASLLVAWAALRPSRGRRKRRAVRPWRVLLVPGVLGAASLGVLLVDHFRHLALAPVLLALGAVIALVLRAALTFLDHARMLERSREEALVDTLTGLGNRRRLERDLERAIADRSARRVLVIFDLDGFKTYNDTFGHPAGDALLVRLGRRLEAALGSRGDAYRMGGDEFCAVMTVPDEDWASVVAATADALAEHGEGFSVAASHGGVLLSEAATPSDALRIADRRMYADKEQRRPSVAREARDVLVTILHEAGAGRHDHLRDVADLAIAVGRSLGLGSTQLEEVARAAELHDIGKMAVPEAVLHKPGPLSEDELGFIRQHTIVGERILGAAPPLRPVAKLVRASHERWDGKGYPDGLAGEAIPLGARIVAVCDAYDAMTTERPYREALGMDEALEELRRCAGSQFDPAVVGAFCAVAEGIRNALAGDVDAGGAQAA